MAEIAFKKMMLENYGIDVPLDFNYYPRGKWDDQDAVINGWRIDIKGTRRGGHWLLIEWNKLCFRQKDNNLSHIYMMFTVDWDRKTDTPTGVVSYEGAVSLAKLNSMCEKTKTLLKGTVLPGTNTKLQADNYGIHFNDLYKHLNHMVDYITHNPPPDTITNNFINPYSGKTTKELANDNNCIVSDEINIEAPVELPISQHSKNKFSAFLKRIRGILRWF